jgi:DNA polymerase elongation subunit (family B)
LTPQAINNFVFNIVLGKMGQSNDKVSKTVIHSYQELVDIRNRSTVKIKHYRILSENALLLTYSTDQEKVSAYKYGNLFIASTVTAFGRLMLVKACKTLEKNGWLCAYTDTDSILAVPIVPNPTPLDQLCDIGLRLGYFKV